MTTVPSAVLVAVATLLATLAPTPVSASSSNFCALAAGSSDRGPLDFFHLNVSTGQVSYAGKAAPTPCYGATLSYDLPGEAVYAVCSSVKSTYNLTTYRVLKFDLSKGSSGEGTVLAEGLFDRYAVDYSAVTLLHLPSEEQLLFVVKSVWMGKPIIGMSFDLKTKKVANVTLPDWTNTNETLSCMFWPFGNGAPIGVTSGNRAFIMGSCMVSLTDGIGFTEITQSMVLEAELPGLTNHRMWQLSGGPSLAVQSSDENGTYLYTSDTVFNDAGGTIATRSYLPRNQGESPITDYQTSAYVPYSYPVYSMPSEYSSHIDGFAEDQEVISGRLYRSMQWFILNTSAVTQFNTGLNSGKQVQFLTGTIPTRWFSMQPFKC